eukprot:scaffold4127_cov124-Isochrysis_galbana.AAC.2
MRRGEGDGSRRAVRSSISYLQRGAGGAVLRAAHGEKGELYGRGRSAEAHANQHSRGWPQRRGGQGLQGLPSTPVVAGGCPQERRVSRLHAHAPPVELARCVLRFRHVCPMRMAWVDSQPALRTCSAGRGTMSSKSGRGRCGTGSGAWPGGVAAGIHWAPMSPMHHRTADVPICVRTGHASRIRR